ncbi:unnamed protein product [Rhizoctonia solani]|uniref:RGS domain-containing protein n=1 Tax=Rhizoctonia solani TaxID=456999 RepID=A0A8H3DST8_9AGAM|nr:unnamed protein product [Rhizoctonia solani]
MMPMIVSPLLPFASLAQGPMLTARRRQQRRRTRVQRPSPHWFTIGSFRSLGRRLRNPPPSSKEERYFWFIAPKYHVSLQDIIADKHPSPLSRQDFEDYLNHAEGSLANLYFHEWVHNYRRIYDEWAQSVLPTATIGLPSSSKHLYPSRELWERLKDCQDRQLRDEFSSARATFFQPGGSMWLNIGAKLRDQVLLIPNLPPPQQLTDKLPSYPNQPEPSLFDPILEQVDRALEAALSRFLRLAFCNAGLWHCCLGHLLGASILAAGLTLWCLGVASRRRGYVAGSLPLIWIGVWFLLSTASGMCLGIYVTGDARQLYPWEVARPLPPGTTPPPTLSVAPVPNDESILSTYSFGRKPSTVSHILPLATPPLPSPQATYQPQANGRRRWSEGVLKIWGRHWLGHRREPIVRSVDHRALDRGARDELHDSLPPARRTKNLPRTSLVLDVEQANGLVATVLPSLSVAPTPKEPAIELTTRRNAAVDLSSDLRAAGIVSGERPDSPFTEENDFGIIVSDAYEAETPREPFHRPAPWTTFSVSSREELATHQEWKPGPPESLDRLAPLIQVPEPALSRRRTMPDIYTPTTETLTVDHPGGSRRGSRSSEHEAGNERYWPWPRTFLGPMTLVHSPLVRRAHWATVWRTAAIAMVVTCGMTLGLIH